MKVRVMTSRNYVHSNIQTPVRKERTAETYGGYPRVTRRKRLVAMVRIRGS
jgi:hypothetical protein